MKILDLNGEWKLSGRKETGVPVQIFSDGEINISSEVPGNLELDLFRAGIIEDPYFGRNGESLRKYEFYEWCFLRDFEYKLTGKRVFLSAEGLDCYATVFVNGIKAGTSENAMIPHRFEISGLLRNGRNTISIHFASANNMFRKYPYLPGAFSIAPFNFESIRVRKPAHVWGWDIAPRMALGGIFRDIFLEEQDDFQIEGSLQLERLYETSARLVYTCKIESMEYDFDNLKLFLDGVCKDSVFHAEGRIWSAQGLVRFTVENPELWYPRGYGKANLYHVTVRLLRNSTGDVLAKQEFYHGIRHVKLKALPLATDDPEPDFQIYINRIPIRVLGFNHVPSDALHSRDKLRQKQILEAACDLNCNMIRVWGGGIYENQEFYDFCDRNGIMVWQDFMMACSRYPNDRDFCEVMEQEAEAAVKRLRHHPSIVIWAGDNECDCTLHYSIPRNPNDNILTRKVLPEVCRLHDGTRPYLESTPWCSPESVIQAEAKKDYPLFQVPEQHLWGGMYYKDDYYSKTPASFITEIGYFGCPDLESIRTFISLENVRKIDCDEWKYHSGAAYLSMGNVWAGRIAGMKNQIASLFSEVPDLLEDFILASQITQAEALKHFIEFIRSSSKRSGILWWNLTDCWPQFSDSVMDYYFHKKLAYYYIRQVQNPLLILLTEENGQLKTVISNCSGQTFTGSYRIFEADTGETVDSGPFRIGCNETLTSGRIMCDPSVQCMYLIEWTLEGGSVTFHNHYLCGKPEFELKKYNEWLEKILAVIPGTSDWRKRMNP